MIRNILSKAKDGGPDSPVDAYFLFEIKWLCSVALLKFNRGSREAFHTHAFNALTWFIKGQLVEEDIIGDIYIYERGLLPKLTVRKKNHRVKAFCDSWCLTIRGPWQSEWTEYNESRSETTTFTHGRKVLSVRNERA